LRYRAEKQTDKQTAVKTTILMTAIGMVTRKSSLQHWPLYQHLQTSANFCLAVTYLQFPIELV